MRRPLEEVSRPKVHSRFFTPPKPRVIAHRGASGDYPENTLPAFIAARDAGVPYLELDVHLTRDGQVVIAHDPDLARMAGRGGPIQELDYKELRTADMAYNFGADRGCPWRGRGAYLPLLAEVLEACPSQRIIIEIKQISPSLVPRLLDLLERTASADRVLIACEFQPPIDEVRTLAPAIPTNFPTPEVADFLRSLPPGAAPYLPRGRALQIPPAHEGWQLVTPETVAAAHRMGVELHVWTVNEAAEMRTLLELGVDGIITDFPARLQRLLIDS